jgi:hypothetical protein
MFQEEKVTAPVQTTFLQAPIKCPPVYTYTSPTWTPSIHSPPTRRCDTCLACSSSWINYSSNYSEHTSHGIQGAYTARTINKQLKSCDGMSLGVWTCINGFSVHCLAMGRLVKSLRLLLLPNVQDLLQTWHNS